MFALSLTRLFGTRPLLSFIHLFSRFTIFVFFAVFCVNWNLKISLESVGKSLMDHCERQSFCRCFRILVAQFFKLYYVNEFGCVQCSHFTFSFIHIFQYRIQESLQLKLRFTFRLFSLFRFDGSWKLRCF